MTLSPVVSRCSGCGTDLASGLLECPGCACLVFAVELSRLAAEAEDAERAADLTRALGSWRRALPLLPPNTKQREIIQARMGALTAAIDGRGPAPGAAGTGRSRAKIVRSGRTAGALGAVGVALLKAKTLLLALLANGKLLILGLLKLPTLLSALVFLRLGSFGGGAGYALGIVACIYVHEMGHVAALRRYGIEASAPMFVPGFGALVRLRQYPTDAHEDARTGLAGPLWGLGAAAVAAAIGALAPYALATGVASITARINLFNLIGVWQLDGARGLRPLARHERWIVGGTSALIGIALHQWLPLLVALPAIASAFASPAAQGPGDRRVLGTFVALVVALAGLSTLPM